MFACISWFVNFFRSLFRLQREERSALLLLFLASFWPLAGGRAVGRGSAVLKAAAAAAAETEGESPRNTRVCVNKEFLGQSRDEGRKETVSWNRVKHRENIQLQRDFMRDYSLTLLCFFKLRCCSSITLRLAIVVVGI